MKVLFHFIVKTFLVAAAIIGCSSLTFAQWSVPINLSPGAVSAILNESMGSCIGVSNDTLHVIWADRFNSKTGAIYYTRSVDTGLTWSAPVSITSLTGNAYNPAIAVNGKNIHVVWRVIDTITQHRTSWYRHSPDGGNTWGAAIALDTSVADWPAVAVSGNIVYVVNDIVTSQTPYNTEIFFLKSTDNGITWSTHQQLTYATGRSEDEAISARGNKIHMSWNDNRTGQMQIYYKESSDYGVSWGPDVAIVPPFDYGTMVSVDGANVDVPCAGAASGHYQIYLVQSADSGVSWGPAVNLTNDPANTYYYPFLTRDGADLHLTYVKSGVGGQYLHSANGGISWSLPYNLGNSQITPFVAYTSCAVHIILPDSGRIKYFRNPTGNEGSHCNLTGISSNSETNLVKVYPNPFEGQATIEILGAENIEQAVLKIYNMLGGEILFSKFGNQRKLIVNSDKLGNGMYIYIVSEKDKVIARGTFIVK
ncbi:MAG: exo-alpha-sialidase [Bacteroidota bacterium]